jgi:hypothetical protein
MCSLIYINVFCDTYKWEVRNKALEVEVQLLKRCRSVHND